MKIFSSYEFIGVPIIVVFFFSTGFNIIKFKERSYFGLIKCPGSLHAVAVCLQQAFLASFSPVAAVGLTRK